MHRKCIRNIKVAERADARNKPYQLRVLNEEESIKLLLKKAFPNQYEKKCPDNLLAKANQLAKMCDGWPLALVVLGGILSTKHPDYNTWDEIMSKLNWSTEGRDCMNIISTSYDDLPVHLKLCFMYFAAFPEDYEIGVPRLIRMWIAEGFIQQETKKEMEDTAMNYLEELVRRYYLIIT
jgi:disease resistance protein RPM1